MILRYAAVLIALYRLCGAGTADSSAAAYHALLADSVKIITTQLAAGADNAALLTRRGQLKMRLEDFGGAAADFTDALGTGNGNTSLLYYRAVCLRALGRPAAAVDDLKQAVSLAPDDASLYAEIGSILLEQNRADEALSWFHRSLKTEPDNPSVRLLRGTCYYVLQNYGKAIPDLTAAITADYEPVRALFLRARSLAAQSLKKKAIADYGRVLEKDPVHFRSLFYRGFLRLETGHEQEGIDDLNAYLKLQGAINPSAEKVRDAIREHGHKPLY